ncbi:hypothetical protein RHGRI_034518 [Rhododendron griersonianum]|uniref:Glucose/Sorbosone dehydrogenase domain-containing protein n=1 Tax=Rhododendron griersonianum TaxID=479676 RepID=A0AAV6I0Y3_9ERIC|nr:hypothetical protein RHGRI_034518 [Rhododendron griersonianum]
MDGVLSFLFLFCHLLLLPFPASSLPMCTDLRAPAIQKTPLAFCPYNGKVCCDSAKDLELRKNFLAMNISDSGCASLVKSILCATCDQYAADLFGIESGPRPVPILCNSSLPTTTNFCPTVWTACQNTSILNSPFAPSLQGSAGGVPQNSTSAKLTDLWQSQTDFCQVFGGAPDNNSLCFNGQPVFLNDTGTLVPPHGMCLEKLDGGQYINLAPHPDGSQRIFLSSQAGKIWLATVPEQGSGESLGLDESNPFVDLSDQVHLDTSFGMMGMAFHPDFGSNGRFFASFNCDKVTSPACSGRCSCNSDVNCDPAKLSTSNGAQPCQYQSVIGEFSANGTASDPSMAKNAKPLEVRRIFTMGLPSTADHGGQILFGPEDGYLYLMMGEGGIKGPEEISDLGLWGNYSIPADNPYAKDNDSEPEIWALGLRNPWRCSFDLERPSYFLCADVGQDRYEEVDLITKGGNYGWSLYEGPLPFNANASAANATDLIFPVLGYTHSDVNKNLGSAAISGGYFYRSATDPCLYGSYLYGDLYSSAIWAAAETPITSGNFTTTSIPFSCATDSPMACNSVPNSRLAALEYIFSFGEDNRKDVFILASSGVYRVVSPSRCNFTCAKETNVTTVSRPPVPSPTSQSKKSIEPHKELVLFLLSLLLLGGAML